MFPPPASLCNPRWFCLARETPWTSGSTPRGATIFIAWESCFNKKSDGSINPYMLYTYLYMFFLNSMVNVGNCFSYNGACGKEKSEMTIYCLRDMFLLDRSREMMARGIRASNHRCRWTIVGWTNTCGTVTGGLDMTWPNSEINCMHICIPDWNASEV